MEQPADGRPSLEVFERPSRRDADIYGTVNWAKPGDKRECRALSVWATECSNKADQHSLTAKSLRAWNAGMVSAVLVFTGASAVMSGLSTDTDFNRPPLSIAALTLSSCAGIATGIMAFIDAAGRRNHHLLAETMYAILARDIAVYLLSTDDPEQGHVLNPDSAIQEYRRRMDNLESSCPPL